MLDIQFLFSLMPQSFQGNKSFIAFSNLGDADALTKTWKVRLLATSLLSLSLLLTSFATSALGLHQSRQLSRARPAS
jgi:hypothetical protein